ncbi:MAG: hypothetical protein MJ180_04935 [Candidatus Gastranaerophilales bacterium]|nr:hypothetical protein [Candidatus Gastranaerophilales bacterium]
MTNSVSNVSFKYSGDNSSNQTQIEEQNKALDQETISFEKQTQEAQEKKEKTKALVEKELNATPIRFGMVATPEQTAKAGATVPIGQSTAKTIDKFSVDKICADIDGFEEVKDDSSIKSMIANFLGKFTVNSTETNSAPKTSAAGLLDVPGMPPMSDEDVAALQAVGVDFSQLQGLTQKSETDKSQAEQLKDKQASFGRMQEIQKQMNDPNVSPEVKAELMKEAGVLLSSTPKAQDTLPAGIVNTSSALAENMSAEDIQAAMSFVQSHATGIDDEDPDFKKLPDNVQGYIRSVASDAKANKDNGVKPADYNVKKPDEIDG